MNNGYEIVRRIDELLKKRNLKRFALAEYCGISAVTITHWSIRGSIPAADTALKIAEYLNVSVEWLITGNDKDGTAKYADIIAMLDALNDEKLKTARGLIKVLSEKQSILP